MLRTEPLPRHEDPRGVLLKAWPRPVEGEVYVVELRPGTSRGHHRHPHGGEWFVPLVGAVLLVVESPEGAREELWLRGLRARVEAGQAHALFNPGPETAWVLAVADRDPAAMGTEPQPIAPPAGLP
jgi:oxalate decarboxylase/phosphoglucose isomerase-like protein (cupin superfamily)